MYSVCKKIQLYFLLDNVYDLVYRSIMTAPTSLIKHDHNSVSLNRKLDLGRALRLRLQKNLSYKDIAKLTNVASSTVYKALSPFSEMFADPSALQAYKVNEADILSGIKLRLLTYLASPDVLQKASANNLAYAFAQLDKSERLSRNQATANVSIQGVVADITGEIEELEEQLGKIK